MVIREMGQDSRRRQFTHFDPVWRVSLQKFWSFLFDSVPTEYFASKKFRCILPSETKFSRPFLYTNFHCWVTGTKFLGGFFGPQFNCYTSRQFAKLRLISPQWRQKFIPLLHVGFFGRVYSPPSGEGAPHDNFPRSQFEPTTVAPPYSFS